MFRRDISPGSFDDFDVVNDLVDLGYTVGDADDHDEVIPKIEEPPDGHWVPPTPVERLLYRDKDDPDASGYLSILATAGVYHLVAITHADQDPAKRQPIIAELSDGLRALSVYTVDVLPRPHPKVVYEFTTLRGLVEMLSDVDVLLVNPETPCQNALQLGDKMLRMMLQLHDEYWEPGYFSGRIITRQSNATEPGSLLHGLACGAQLCATNGYAWNTTEHHGNGYSAELALVEKWWDVKVRDDWLQIERRLLDRDVGSSSWDDVLHTRNLLADHVGGPADAAQWRQYDESAFRQYVAQSGAPAHPGADPRLDAVVAARGHLITRILHYEDRFREDRLLPAGGSVRSTAAWDLGRASAMARWGRSTRFCTQAEMFDALRELSQEAQRRYTSWEEFGVGYLLGRCLHFDEDSFGSWYTDARDIHERLLSYEQSPWLTVPFR
ncbi:uncharacterized protein DUF1266 [Kribbella sp. VKM Ac-2569]|uniref:DUF1266 domain-containing protein n=1 Tax=Kribbella sp. VKM Ac-2569 TaxID=2512220 RepID=UPI00102BE146|nr:DUF1266 domain-containing protein [Kribbella sp. VKM Ac-2569]RZT12041.1 uncharacterized protein DUF1266 [Kribbella sp. VKM Ac-2569]